MQPKAFAPFPAGYRMINGNHLNALFTGAETAPAFQTSTGNSWFVNETTGTATGGGSVASPFATLAQAQTAAVANNGDVVYLTGSIHLTATLNWAKNNVSLVGLNSPSNNARARISTASVAQGLTQTLFTALHPLVNVTAQGCSFVNLGTFFGGDGSLTPPTAAICWAEAGGRNFYSDVQFFGGGDVLMAALAGMRSITVGGQGENVFSNCTFGLDTVTRATNANATLEFINGTARNVFYNPVFQSYVSTAGDLHVLTAANGADRYQYMFNPVFANAVDSGATTMSAAVTWAGGSPAGGLIITGGISVGATAIATTGPVYTNMPQANAAAGVGVKLT